jgi:hypothetical protein
MRATTDQEYFVERPSNISALTGRELVRWRYAARGEVSCHWQSDRLGALCGVGSVGYTEACIHEHVFSNKYACHSNPETRCNAHSCVALVLSCKQVTRVRECLYFDSRISNCQHKHIVADRPHLCECHSTWADTTRTYENHALMKKYNVFARSLTGDS